MPIKISIVTGNNGASFATRLGAGATLNPLSVHHTGEEAIREVPGLNPDVLLVDISLPCMDGFECARRIKYQMPNLPILMLAAEGCRNELTFASVHVGANGCLPTFLPMTEWVEAIEEVYAGARRGRRKVLMLFNSDRQFANAACHWTKMAALISARTTTVHYGPEWRRVVVTGKKAKKNLFRPPKIIDRRYGNGFSFIRTFRQPPDEIHLQIPSRPNGRLFPAAKKIYS